MPICVSEAQEDGCMSSIAQSKHGEKGPYTLPSDTPAVPQHLKDVPHLQYSCYYLIPKSSMQVG
eukprot:351773-Chlamydomonas_euryale.AAC.26